MNDQALKKHVTHIGHFGLHISPSIHKQTHTVSMVVASSSNQCRISALNRVDEGQRKIAKNST